MSSNEKTNFSKLIIFLENEKGIFAINPFIKLYLFSKNLFPQRFYWKYTKSTILIDLIIDPITAEDTFNLSGLDLSCLTLTGDYGSIS